MIRFIVLFIYDFLKRCIKNIKIKGMNKSESIKFMIMVMIMVMLFCFRSVLC